MRDQWNPTQEQFAELARLAREMRAAAGPVGPLHAWWDHISDLEALMRGREPLLRASIDQHITMARDALEASRVGRRVTSVSRGGVATIA